MYRISQLTLRLLVSYRLNSTAYACRLEHGVLVTATAPSAGTQLHSLEGELANLGADIPDVEQPLLHGRSNRVLDLTT